MFGMMCSRAVIHRG